MHACICVFGQFVSISHYTETCECMRVYVCLSVGQCVPACICVFGQLVSVSRYTETCECMRVYVCSVSLSVCPATLRHVNACVYMCVRSVGQCVALH